MKKVFLTLTVLAFFLLSSCNNSSTTEVPSDSTDATVRVESPSNAVTTPKSDDDLNSNTPSPFSSDNPISSVMQAFKSVLLNEKTFSCTDKVPYYSPSTVQQFNGYLNQITYENSPVKTPQFAIADLNGDGISEIVLAIEEYKGFIILRYKDGEVYGNIVSYRTMMILKEDGSFEASSGASDNSIGKMFFIGDTFILEEKIASRSGSPADSYYTHDIPTEKEIWDKHLASFNDSPDVEWHDYSEESITQWISDNSFSAEMPTSSKTAIAKRQDYLDSLAYLIDLTSNEQKNGDELNSAANSYYNGCMDEMNKIYHLCKEKLSDNELETLNTEQLHWQENLEKEISKFLSNNQVDSIDELKEQSEYFRWGDMILRRICYLVNIYYDYHIHD